MISKEHQSTKQQHGDDKSALLGWPFISQNWNTCTAIQLSRSPHCLQAFLAKGGRRDRQGGVSKTSVVGHCMEFYLPTHCTRLLPWGDLPAACIVQQWPFSLSNATRTNKSCGATESTPRLTATVLKWISDVLDQQDTDNDSLNAKTHFNQQWLGFHLYWSRRSLGSWYVYQVCKNLTSRQRLSSPPVLFSFSSGKWVKSLACFFIRNNTGGAYGTLIFNTWLAIRRQGIREGVPPCA